MSPDEPQPLWLVAGARVRVRIGSSTSGREYEATIASVEWPWLVHLDGQPGGCHPWRILGPVDALGRGEGEQTELA